MIAIVGIAYGEQLTQWIIDSKTPRIYQGAAYTQLTYNVNEPLFVALYQINGTYPENIAPFTTIVLQCSGVKNFVRYFKMTGQFIIIPAGACGQDYTGTNFEIGVSPVPLEGQSVVGYWGSPPWVIT